MQSAHLGYVIHVWEICWPTSIDQKLQELKGPERLSLLYPYVMGLFFDLEDTRYLDLKRWQRMGWNENYY